MDSRRHGIRRVVTRVIVFLLLGAAVNVAVAWGLALLVKPDHDWKPQEGQEFVHDSSWNGVLYSSETQTSKSVLYNRYHDPSRDDPRFRNNPRSIPSWVYRALRAERLDMDRWFIAKGWPTVALWREDLIDHASTHHSRGALDVGLAPWKFGGIFGFTMDRSVPLRPIWPGFAINTVFYSAVCWLLFAAPYAVRRRLRLRRGQCPHCAYPIGTSNLCTECGAVLPLPPGEGRGEGV